jgi:predicted O-linked N-acetylglucosamine transferase (SPINDLY family)
MPRDGTALAAPEAALALLEAGDAAGARALLEALPREDVSASRFAALGMVALAEGDGAAALAALRAAVAAGDHSPSTLLNVALAEERAGDVPRARALMQALAVRLPEWDEPLARLAESQRRGGETEAAEATYERALAVNPRRTQALIALAVLLLQRGETGRAQLLLLRCCDVAPGEFEAWDALGTAYLIDEQPAAAEAAFARAQELVPQNLDLALRRIDASVRADHAETELARLERATRADPLDVVLLTARGVLLGRLGRNAEAADILEVATCLAPGALGPIRHLASVLFAEDRGAEAEALQCRAIELAPDDVKLRFTRTAMLVRLHRYADAEAALRALIEEHGDSPELYANLSTALVQLGRQDEALAAARRATVLAPNWGSAWRALCNLLPYHPDANGAELLAVCQHLAARGPSKGAGSFDCSRDPDRRLRLGLLSAQLRTHPVGWLTIAGFENLDPAAFDIVCIGHARSNDPIQRRFAAIASVWHAACAPDPAALAAQIRDLGIDILIEMSGYGDRGMMTACAHRAAPVQIRWVGSQYHSSGLAEMDWFITDRWETPPGFDRFYSEALLRMPDGYACYSPPPYAPDVQPLPALRRGAVTFGCFNNLAKITPLVIETWAAILRRLPGARLMLKTYQFNDPALAETLRGRFAALGVAAERLDLFGISPHRELLEQYNKVDIVLDPFPYAGGLTTCEALWMGVPVVTVPGETFASRHSTSHLNNVGLGDWVAADLAGYQELALRAAADLPALAALRAGLRARMRASPLCDGPRFGRNLGAAMRDAWRSWCAGRDRASQAEAAAQAGGPSG